MSKPKKNDKPSDPSEDEDGDVKPAPWAIEIEFFNKPSFMTSVMDLKIDAEHISITKDDGSTLSFPYEAVRKVLSMQTKRPKYELD